jgi:hypothetical protein
MIKILIGRSQALRLSLTMLTAALATSAAAVAAGPSLGLVLGGLSVAAILQLRGNTELRGRLAAAAAEVAGIAVIWLALVGPDRATLGQWITLLFMLAAFSVARVGLASLLETIRMNQQLAAGLVTVIALAWLTWPVWLSPAMEAPAIRRMIPSLIKLNPGLVANGVLTYTPPWTEQTIAYQLTVLNQDVPIQLPSSALPCIMFHALIGCLGIAVNCYIKILYDLQCSMAVP